MEFRSPAKTVQTRYKHTYKRVKTNNKTWNSDLLQKRYKHGTNTHTRVKTNNKTGIQIACKNGTNTVQTHI